MKRVIYILIGIWAMSMGLMAQETIVVGQVYDANTGEAIENVNIYLQGTQKGATSNEEGLFLLRADIDRARTMVVSAVGYHIERFKLEPHTQVGIEVALREKVGNLAEVFVVPSDNPALPLMEKVRARRAANRVATAEAENSQTALYVSDIESKHLKRALWKSLQAGMIAQDDSSYLVPLYWREKQADVLREQATLLTTTDYQLLLSHMPTHFDFYNNTLPLLSTSLLSPLAASGNMYYHYYLVDSLLVGAEKHYLLHFKTKNPFYATFNGEMTIDSASCALRSMQVNVPAKNSVNYLKEFRISQQYGTDNQLLTEQVSVLMDFAVKVGENNDSTHIFPTLLLTRSQLMDKYVAPDNNGTLDSSVADDMVLPALDSLNNTFLFKLAKLVAYGVNTGCVPVNKYVEIGKVHHMFKLSDWEGFRLGLPLRTTDDLWKNVCLEAMVAYGFGDRAWKGIGQVNVALSTERRHTMFARYSDEYVFSDVDDFHEYQRENVIFNRQINLVTRMMQFAPFNPDYYYNTMVRRREARVQFVDDWNPYLETQSYIKTGRMGYGEPVWHNYKAQPSFRYTTLGASARLSFQERKVDTYFERRYVYNHKPVVYLGAELGSYQLDGMRSYAMYGNLQLMVRHNVDLGMVGELSYLAEAGMVLGRVPYGLLHHFTGNPTHTFDPQRFSLMNSFQYAADKYVAVQANWNGKGVLFNLIPGVRHLRLRELLEMKLAYGTLSDKHQQILAFPTTQTGYSTLNSMKVPYVEAGAGIGNILRVGEVYAVFKLTQWQDPQTPWWAVRFRLHLGM